MLDKLDKLSHMEPAYNVFNMSVSDKTKQVLEE